MKTSPDGAVTHLGDVSRVEMGASEYALRASMDGKKAVQIIIFQQPNANSLQISDHIPQAHGRHAEGQGHARG